MDHICETNDLIVFSHLRWDFVFQRPHHLMSRFAKHRRVFYIEEPYFEKTNIQIIEQKKSPEGVQIIIPHLSDQLTSNEIQSILRLLIDELILNENITDYSTWYYTPMALSYTRHLNPKTILFDCMDELSLFKNAPESLIRLEDELFQKAHLVFTGGVSLYQAKKHRHHNIHPFPSSIDYEHFSSARIGSKTYLKNEEPEDQKNILHPRIGYYGVLDERLDLDLIEKMAILKPEWNFIFIGPIVKIDPDTLPVRENIYYLGKKDYLILPSYLSGWDCAMMPFALNDSTRFISPTKTPEFLAAGIPVVSTAINDVVHPYEDEGLALISRRGPQDFVSLIEDALSLKVEDENWIRRIDKFLSRNSWDKTFGKIASLEKERLSTHALNEYHLEAGSYIVLNDNL